MAATGQSFYSALCHDAGQRQPVRPFIAPKIIANHRRDGKKLACHAFVLANGNEYW
jgi:hypothetical protein